MRILFCTGLAGCGENSCSLSHRRKHLELVAGVCSKLLVVAAKSEYGIYISLGPGVF